MNIDTLSPYRKYSVIDEKGFKDMVSLCAYAKYVQRGFLQGNANQDWLEAEKEVTIRCFYWVHDGD